jgi:hypothetical protein
MLKNFKRAEGGTVATAFALSSIAILGAAGLAVDYARLEQTRSFLQEQADAAALGTASEGLASDGAHWLKNIKANFNNTYSEGAAAIVAANGKWLNDTDYSVEMKAKVNLSLMQLVPGVGDKSDVLVTSVARRNKEKMIYKPPVVSQLDPEASDYNRIYVYCYDDEKKNNADKGRSQETAVADNGGTVYNYQMPRCESGESMSYHLYNVRGARTSPHLWDKGNATRYHYYTDTKIENDAEAYDLGGYSLLETVLCDSLAACTGKSKGGVIPEGKNRTPVRATQKCLPGKFMYYGFEDRPPGLGWTDKDYDDIRIIIECPTLETDTTKNVRLIK